jgi:hypothetical protein
MHRLFIALILLSLTCGSYAAEVNNLYQAQSPISSRDEQLRQQLMPQLLRQVILKVVGNQALVDSTELEAVLSKASEYLQTYEYERLHPISADLTQPDQLSIKLKFDQNAVNQAISQLGLPIWGKIRPDVLSWVAVKHDQQHYLLGQDDIGLGVTQPLQSAADNRGLPFLTPLMDLQDQTQLNFDAIWQQNDVAVQTASQRYGADIILVSRITMTQESAQVDWQAFINGEVKHWQSTGSLQQALSDGVGQLADTLATQYSQPADTDRAEQRISMQVADVLDYQDFSRVMSYLRQLDYITEIRVLNLSEQKLDLDIAFNSNLAVLKRTLSVGRMLIEENHTEGNAASYYRLLP